MNLSFFVEPVDFSFYTDILADRSLAIAEADFYCLVVAVVAVDAVRSDDFCFVELDKRSN